MRSILPWLLIVCIAVAIVLVPWWWVWSESKNQKRRVPKPLVREAPPLPGPLILYAETWPTRVQLNIEEIQASSTETDHALGPKAVAKDFALALDELGIVVEPQRLSDLPKDADLLTGRPIVLIYPVRHGQPPAGILQFIDTRIEPLVGQQFAELKNMRFYDIAIAENEQQAGGAHDALQRIFSYYKLSYKPGANLLEPMNSIVIYENLQKFAQSYKQTSAP